jgi:hypothetical protein
MGADLPAGDTSAGGLTDAIREAVDVAIVSKYPRFRVSSLESGFGIYVQGLEI